MATEPQIPVIAARLVEHQDGFASFTTEDGQWVIQNTVEAISLFVEAVKNRTKMIVGYFRRLGLLATIPATTGKRTISSMKILFTGYLDTDFRNWNIGANDKVKPACLVESLELAKNGRFNDFFTAYSADLNKLVLTDEQVLWVVENRPDLLIQNGSANFFLLKKGDEFFVAHVFWYVGRLEVRVRRLSNDFVWGAGYGRRIVVPQL